MSEHKFISLSYDLYTKVDGDKLELVERAPKERPFQFITGIGYALDTFEKNVKELSVGDSFDFEIPVGEAYGEYEEENKITLPKSVFSRDGKFDSENVQEGKVIPLSDGTQTFNALVTKITADEVFCDLNHPLAGRDLLFMGKILESRPATDEEVKKATQPSGCGGCSGCGGDCNCSGDCSK